jgi:hypothetical protein
MMEYSASLKLVTRYASRNRRFAKLLAGIGWESAEERGRSDLLSDPSHLGGLQQAKTRLVECRLVDKRFCHVGSIDRSQLRRRQEREARSNSLTGARTLTLSNQHRRTRNRNGAIRKSAHCLLELAFDAIVEKPRPRVGAVRAHQEKVRNFFLDSEVRRGERVQEIYLSESSSRSSVAHGRSEGAHDLIDGKEPCRRCQMIEVDRVGLDLPAEEPAVQRSPGEKDDPSKCVIVLQHAQAFTTDKTSGTEQQNGPRDSHTALTLRGWERLRVIYGKLQTENSKLETATQNSELETATQNSKLACQEPWSLLPRASLPRDRAG